MIVFTLKFDLAKAAIAKHLASNTNIQLVLCDDPRGWHSEEFLEFGFACWEQGGGEENLLVIFWSADD